MSKLLIRPKQHPNECIVSYLVRVSEKNVFNHIGHLLQYGGFPWKNLRAPTHQMITGEYDIQPYFTNLGLRYATPATANIFRASQGPSFSTKIFVKSPKICPKSLYEKGYSPYLWNFISYTACTKHKILLIDSNPRTGKKLSWYRSTLDKFSKDDSFPPENAFTKASPDTLAFTNIMKSLIEGISSPQSMPAVLSDLNFADTLSIIHFIAHYQYRLFHKELFSAASLDNFTVSHYYTQAWQTLESWPHGFNLLLKQYVDNPMSIRGQSGINKHFRDLHEKLHRQRNNKGIARLRAAFDQFIENKWPNALHTNRLTRISLSSNDRQLITQKEAQRIRSCREPRIHSLITQGRITPHQFKGHRYFNRDQIEGVAKLLNENWSMQQAVEETELSRYQLKQLLDSGLVRSLQSANSQNRDWLICKHSWQRNIETWRKASIRKKQKGKILSGIQKQGYNISEVFVQIINKNLEFTFVQKAEKPFSFKQLTEFSNKTI